MPKKSKNETIKCRHFRWKLVRRRGHWTGDGRSGNAKNVGRHSLGTTDKSEALDRLHQLDLVMAVRHGLAEPTVLKNTETKALTLAEGRRRYEAHLSRPEMVGGACKHTRARYAAVLDKFLAFAKAAGVDSWNGVTKQTLTAYVTKLRQGGYSDASIYLEAVLVKQLMKWQASEQLIPQECLFSLKLRKPTGTSTHCYTPNQIAAMERHCRCHPALTWLADVIVALSRTGMRVRELANLRWSDVDFEKNLVQIRNDVRQPGKADHGLRRTKNRKNRHVPLHAELQAVLKRLPRHRDGHVFHGLRGGRLKSDTVRVILQRDVIAPLAKRFPAPPSERGFPHATVHGFRHAFISQCANRGVPEQTVMAWVGHQNSRIARHYYTLSDQESQRQMRRLSFADGAAGDEAADSPSASTKETPPGGEDCS